MLFTYTYIIPLCAQNGDMTKKRHGKKWSYPKVVPGLLLASQN